jgi:membrane protease YdiL (CAAX protease family)
MEDAYQKQVEAIVTLNNPIEFISALFIMAFLPALCEEALFRGGLQNFLTRSTRIPWLSILVVSIIFSAVHFSWYGFLSRFFLGIVLGLVFHYSGRLWLSIIAHFFNNALAITLLYIAKQEGKPMQEAMNEGADTLWGLVALPVLIVLFMWFRKISGGQSRK